MLYNQMDAAGYSPSAHQMLTMVYPPISYITLYDNIMVSLNKPDNFLLPNIHHLFDRITRIDGNVTCSQTLNHDLCTHQSPNQPVIALSSATTTAPIATDETMTNAHKCSNCGRMGHMDETCFQPSGKWRVVEMNT
jgi:hypothetical protein